MSLPGITSFTEQIGSSFEVANVAPSPLVLELFKVVTHAKTETNEAFSIFLLGPSDRIMPQGTRKLRHTQFGEMELFLVPVARTSAGFEYEAVFNYLLSR